MLQIHGPSGSLTAKDVRASMNGGDPDFAVLKFGPISFYIDNPEQCDWLIKAAVEAKRLLSPPVPGKDEPCSPDAAGAPYHVTGAEACCLAETGNYICNAQAGHDGPEHVAYGSHGEECHRWSVAETPASVTA